LLITVVAKLMWFYHWCWKINELLRNFRECATSVLDLLHLFCCLLRQCHNLSLCHAPPLSQAFGAKKNSGINLGVNYQDSSVVSGVTKGPGGTILRRRMTAGAPRSPNNVTSIRPTFINTIYLPPKGLRFEPGTPKLLFSTGAI